MSPWMPLHPNPALSAGCNRLRDSSSEKTVARVGDRLFLSTLKHSFCARAINETLNDPP